ncbi:hypothetical protein TrRE_jg3299 [Triparma retinervis]|uniref:Anaphase-promoting complex subunit 11 n=1 Tax=Triparma retinervis TaxID=2557542 RepID=A0A9W6ZJE5_9STRA|nr:hypothetical protein TrRE_jg3299 [Triparma retinervis]
MPPTKRDRGSPIPTSTTKPSPSPPVKEPLKVKVKAFHGIARWSWGTPADDVCGICQSPFEGCAPGVKFPGDDCPVVWGACKHAYHLACISQWLSGGKNSCPICRADWNFADDS